MALTGPGPQGREESLAETQRGVAARIAQRTAVLALLVTAGALALWWAMPSSSEPASAPVRQEPPGLRAAAGGRRPNVVLVSIDSLRADHLGAYGYPRPTSPRLDRLAAEGVVFDSAWSTTTWTLPSHVSLLTALYPEVHGVTEDGLRMTADQLLLSEVLRSAGYRTAAFVSAPFLNRIYGFDQGFDLYDDVTIPLKRHRESHRGSTGAALHGAITRWLGEGHGEPFFLFLHYWDVHFDYEPPPAFVAPFDPGYRGAAEFRNFEKNRAIHPGMPEADLARLVALYDGEIAYTDHHLGLLFDELERLGKLEDSLVVVTGDHGDEFFEHGEKGHMKNLFETTLRVPLVVRFPGGAAGGTRVAEPVSLVDVGPTLLDALGVARPPVFDGESLVDLAAGQRRRRPRPIFAGLYGRSWAVRSGDLKLVRVERTGEPPSEALFDLAADPGEVEDLAPSRRDEARQLSDLLARWRRHAAGQRREAARPFEKGEGLRETLESLGYL